LIGKDTKVDQGQDLPSLARAIIDSIPYMVLGTADENGRPWASPVYFASEKYREFYWMSSPEVRHSRNILIRPEVSIVIFDSRVPIGMGQAVYMSAVGEELTGLAFDRGIRIYNGRFSDPAEHGVRIIKPEDVRAPAPYRLYRATVHEHWVLDPAGHPDHRTPVSL
jgi:uncharacterized protein YhbP (UPF0306 family)